MILRVIVACHNRRELTSRAVVDVRMAADRAGLRSETYVFDDGSTDGTGEALRELDPPVMVLQGDGTAFWAKGMAVAERAALSDASDTDWLLWLNDDVVLDRDAMARARIHMSEYPDRVLVGALREPGVPETSYGGYRLWNRWMHPTRIALVRPSDSLRTIDTFNGNFVLVPVGVARTLGGIDGDFPHSGADLDYGFRCVKRGIAVRLLPGTFGECGRRPAAPPGALLADWRALVDARAPTGPRTVSRLLRKHAPIRWPIYFMSKYAAWWLRRLTGNGPRAGDSTLPYAKPH
ncbi:MAG TPA: glycosyltransferase [Microbacteriaceae bacterium]|nr:glycosyltransferase [Microbacteriaceae bacterium]